MENDSFKVNVKSYAGKLSLYYIFLLFSLWCPLPDMRLRLQISAFFIQPLQINEIIYPDTWTCLSGHHTRNAPLKDFCMPVLSPVHRSSYPLILCFIPHSYFKTSTLFVCINIWYWFIEFTATYSWSLCNVFR